MRIEDYRPDFRKGAKEMTEGEELRLMDSFLVSDWKDMEGLVENICTELDRLGRSELKKHIPIAEYIDHRKVEQKLEDVEGYVLTHNGLQFVKASFGDDSIYIKLERIK